MAGAITGDAATRFRLCRTRRVTEEGVGNNGSDSGSPRDDLQRGCLRSAEGTSVHRCVEAFYLRVCASVELTPFSHAHRAMVSSPATAAGGQTALCALREREGGQRERQAKGREEQDGDKASHGQHRFNYGGGSNAR